MNSNVKNSVSGLVYINILNDECFKVNWPHLSSHSWLVNLSSVCHEHEIEISHFMDQQQPPSGHNRTLSGFSSDTYILEQQAELPLRQHFPARPPQGTLTGYAEQPKPPVMLNTQDSDHNDSERVIEVSPNNRYAKVPPFTTCSAHNLTV